MRHSLLPVVAVLLCATTSSRAPAQDVKYEKFKLPNGMTVILHEDRALPVATINIWYRVGSQDEPTGRTGFAHLFEHLMFMGTKRVPGADFDNLMEAGGGSNNASTDFHRTNYFSSGPAKLLPTLLWLDADRLEDMGLFMTQEKLDKQRAIVRNELRQVIENRPYGKAEEFITQLMYPPTHPYHIGVAGLHTDLEAATVTNVKDFFANFYVPNNASLVVAGDFDAASIKPMVEKLFGTIPAGPSAPRRTAEPVKLDRVMRYTMIDKVELPKIMFVYHSPRAFEAGDAEMDLVAAVLTSGKTSRLYKRLVMDEKLASDVDASQSSYPMGSMFQIHVLTKPDADLDRVEKIVDEELAQLAGKGPTAEELDERKTSYEMRMLSGLQSISSKADKLNEYEYFWGEPNSFKRDLDRYRNATPAGLKDWAAKVLTPGGRAVIRVLPEAPKRSESARDSRPGDAAQRAFAPAAPERFNLSNGMPVMLWRRSELPLVSMTLAIKAGSALDAPGKGGAAQLAADMLDEGAGKLDALQFAQALQRLGAQFGAGVDQEMATVSLSVLKRNFEQAGSLVADAVRRPRMEQSDWDRVKSLHLDELKQQDEEPTAVAAIVAARAFYGDSNPYGRPSGGTPESVAALSLDDVKAAHGSVFSPEGAALLVAGDLTIDEARAVLEKNYGDWKPGGSSSRAAPSVSFGTPTSEKLRVVLVHRPEAVQTVIRYQSPGIKFTDSRRISYQLLNVILGGSFTSRLNQNLREDKGYTYGARSSYAMEISTGGFTAGAAVRADATGASLREFMSEFGRIRQSDITDGESTKARETLRNNLVQSLSGLRGVVSSGLDYWANQLSYDRLTSDIAAIEEVKTADLNALARAALPIEQGVLVLVGDRDVVLSQIKELNLPPPIECDVRGVPVKGEASTSSKSE